VARTIPLIRSVSPSVAENEPFVAQSGTGELVRGLAGDTALMIFAHHPGMKMRSNQRIVWEEG
jgi:hypothetical protein